MQKLLKCLATAFAMTMIYNAIIAADWLQWRGPQRDGQLQNVSLPDDLSDDRLTLVWESELGPSYSGPIVKGDLVFTTETVNKASERVTCFDLSSGEKRWQAEWKGAMIVPFFAASNGSWIRATPACNDEKLIVGGMLDVIVCLEVQTGNELWRVDFPEKLGSPIPSFGNASSPIIDQQFVYVQAGGGLTKMSLEDGSIVWQSLKDGPDMSSSGAFSSPIIAELGGQRQLIVQTRMDLAGVALDDGRVLWQRPIEAYRGMNILTPTLWKDRIFTSNYRGKSQMLLIESHSSGYSTKLEWENKAQAYMSSPVLVDDAIYVHLQNKRLVCLDAATGTENWTTTPFGSYWSMVTDGKKILALDSDGRLQLIAADKKQFTSLGSAKVAEDSWAYLALSDDFVVVRDLERLRVFRWTR